MSLSAQVTAQESPQLEATLAEVPCLRGRIRALGRLEGGLTNVIVRVETDGGPVVARVSTADSSMLAIDRDAEHLASLAAAEAGVAPEVVCRSVEPPVLVVGWIEGRTLAAADIRDPSILPRVAELCQKLHRGRPFPHVFDMFEVQAKYLRIVQQQGYRLPAGYLDHLPSFERMRRALAVHPAPLVPCHNDLLAENFLDDGDRLWMVDFEYSGNNEAAFELGNLASESLLTDAQLAELVRLYHGAGEVADVSAEVARARLLATASKYGWTLWGCIQDGASSLDFDFWSWGLEKYDRAVEEFGRADFESLLQEVSA